MGARKFVGFKPFSYQRAVIDELCFPGAQYKGRIVCCKSQRQRGKSFMNANILLYYSINFPRSKNYCVTPTLKQAKEIYKTIIAAIGESGVIKSSNATDLIITLINNSTINFKSAEQGATALRGYTCTGILIIDEAAYIPGDIFNTILPWVDFHKANILMTSTPFIKDGFFYQHFNYGLDGLYNCRSVDWCDDAFKSDMEAIMPQSRLDTYRKTLPKNVFLTDYLGEWLDDDGVVFTNFKSCCKDMSPTPGDRLYVGVDWAAGGEGDDTVVVAFNQRGQQVYLDVFNNLDTTRQIDRIEQFLVQHKKQIVVVETELNSLGTPMTDILKARPQVKNLNYVGFNTTNTSKNTLVTNLQVAFEQQEISILPDQKQLRELSYFTAEYNIKTRTVSYSAPRGLHDDIPMAMMFAYDAYHSGQNSGNYNISFVRRKHGYKS